MSSVNVAKSGNLCPGTVVRFLDQDVMVVRVPTPTNIVVARATWWRRVLARLGFYRWRARR